MANASKQKLLEKSQWKLVVFEDKKIRRIFHKSEWYFSIIDIIRVLTESSDPNRYWPELKKKLLVDEGFSQLLDKIERLKLESSDGKKYLENFRGILAPVAIEMETAEDENLNE